MAIRFSILFTLLMILQGCGDGSLGTESSGDTTTEKKLFAGGVKLIASGISDPRDPSSMQQNTYTLNSNRRLLTRLEGMGDRSERAIVDGEVRMYIVISSEAFIENRGTFETALEVCPITSNWMMLATWDRAHPFPTSSGNWDSRGGDFSSTDCVTADTSYEIPEGKESSMYFDVSDWYLFYVRSRNRNFGLMVKTDQELVIYGDEDSLRAPHFIWQE